MLPVRRLNRLCVFVATGVLVASLQVAHAQKVHAILVGDTDSNLSEGVTENLKSMGFLLNSINQLGRVDVARVQLSGDKFTCSNIRKAVRKLQVKPDDTVIFYYAGHGFRRENAPTKFPEFDCATSTGGDQIDLSTVVKLLVGKKPRFVLAIADACNVVVQRDEEPSAAAPPSLPEERAAGLRRLFTGYSGTLMMSGAKPNEFAWYMNDGELLGGFFTRQLARAINAGVGKADNAHWEDIASSAIEQIDIPNEGGAPIKQNPQFEAIGLKRR